MGKGKIGQGGIMEIGEIVDKLKDVYGDKAEKIAGAFYDLQEYMKNPSTMINELLPSSYGKRGVKRKDIPGILADSDMAGILMKYGERVINNQSSIKPGDISVVVKIDIPKLDNRKYSYQRPTDKGKRVNPAGSEFPGSNPSYKPQD